MRSIKRIAISKRKLLWAALAGTAAAALLAGPAWAAGPDQTPAPSVPREPAAVTRQTGERPALSVSHYVFLEQQPQPETEERTVAPKSREVTTQEVEPGQMAALLEEAASQTYLWPVSGVITSHFGYREVSVGSTYHRGIDIGADGGSPIAAARSGQVTYAGYNDGGYGYLVIVDHGDGASTYYAHCSELLVSQGDTVSQGQTIALVGSTGVSTGDHCHFEIRLSDEPVDPLDYLPEQP